MKKSLMLFGLLSLCGVAAQAQDIEAGKKTWDSVCVACHGANGEGNKAMNAPANGGQEAWYVARQLKNFKEGIRGTHEKDSFGAQMRPMAMTLADDDAINNVAAYLESLPVPTAPATIEGDAEKGKSLYGVCVACHGANGEGNKALNAPRLAGQHDWYLARQVANFRDGVRGSDPKDIYGQQMRPMSMTLTSEEAINDVIAYINTLAK